MSEDSQRDRIEKRLIEKDESDEFGEDGNHLEVDCRYCDDEHLGELYSSPPDGHKVRYYCTEYDRTGRRSVP